MKEKRGRRLEYPSVIKLVDRDTLLKEREEKLKVYVRVLVVGGEGKEGEET